MLAQPSRQLSCEAPPSSSLADLHGSLHAASPAATFVAAFGPERVRELTAGATTDNRAAAGAGAATAEARQDVDAGARPDDDDGNNDDNDKSPDVAMSPTERTQADAGDEWANGGSECAAPLVETWTMSPSAPPEMDDEEEQKQEKQQEEEPAAAMEALAESATLPSSSAPLKDGEVAPGPPLQSGEAGKDAEEKQEDQKGEQQKQAKDVGYMEEIVLEVAADFTSRVLESGVELARFQSFVEDGDGHGASPNGEGLSGEDIDEAMAISDKTSMSPPLPPPPPPPLAFHRSAADLDGGGEAVDETADEAAGEASSQAVQAKTEVEMTDAADGRDGETARTEGEAAALDEVAMSESDHVSERNVGRLMEGGGANPSAPTDTSSRKNNACVAPALPCEPQPIALAEDSMAANAETAPNGSLDQELSMDVERVAPTPFAAMLLRAPAVSIDLSERGSASLGALPPLFSAVVSQQAALLPPSAALSLPSDAPSCVPAATRSLASPDVAPETEHTPSAAACGDLPEPDTHVDTQSAMWESRSEEAIRVEAVNDEANQMVTDHGVERSEGMKPVEMEEATLNAEVEAAVDVEMEVHSSYLAEPSAELAPEPGTMAKVATSGELAGMQIVEAITAARMTPEEAAPTSAEPRQETSSAVEQAEDTDTLVHVALTLPAVGDCNPPSPQVDPPELPTMNEGVTSNASVSEMAAPMPTKLYETTGMGTAECDILRQAGMPPAHEVTAPMAVASSAPLPACDVLHPPRPPTPPCTSPAEKEEPSDASASLCFMRPPAFLSESQLEPLPPLEFQTATRE